MATDQDLLIYFKQASKRNDWDIDDFRSSRREIHEFFEEINFILKSISQLSVCSDQALLATQTRLGVFLDKITNEINRRSV